MSTKSQQQRFIGSASEPQREIIQLLTTIAQSKGLTRVWADWVEISAIALANAVDKNQYEQRERRYLEVIAEYAKEEVHGFAKALGLLVECLEQCVVAGEFGDVLGTIFMGMNMGESRSGQFFTPYEVSRLMSEMILGSPMAISDRLGDKGFLSIQEPACGAGGMAIALAHALMDEGYNYQKVLHVTAIDIDLRCVHMTYLQLALLHVPAVVIHGDALAGRIRGKWYTPAHILGGWPLKLAQEYKLSSKTESSDKGEVPVHELPTGADEENSAQTIELTGRAGQISLF